MGAKDWMLFYASDDVSKVLRSAPKIDREATAALVRRLYPSHDIRPIADGTLSESANPPEGEVYAAVFPDLDEIVLASCWTAARSRWTPLSPARARARAGSPA